MSNPQLSLSLPPEVIQQLRELAAHHGTTVGTVARALIIHGLDESAALAVVESIGREISLARERRVEIGRRAMSIRYASHATTKKETTP